MKYRAKVVYKAAVEVEFDFDGQGWRELQQAAVEAAKDQDLIPDSWTAIEWPVPEPFEEKKK